MNEAKDKTDLILISGNDKLTWSITVCLLRAGYRVSLHTQNEEKALESIREHAADIEKYMSSTLNLTNLEIRKDLAEKNYRLAIAIRTEELNNKLSAVREIERVVSENTIIAINTEIISLSDIQPGSEHPGRIIGANWVEPAHTSFFLEIISNQLTNEELVNDLYSTALAYWGKDPYIVKTDYSIRARMMSALIREAFYLIENGYVSFEDVDRACRNDAGYYLPFAGNFRYMDLMGTYIYGLVMKDMNPDLSKERQVPQFFNDLMDQGRTGMEIKKGFYQYDNAEVEKWKELTRVFSYQIQEIISKYPFNYLGKGFQSESKTNTVL